MSTGVAVCVPVADDPDGVARLLRALRAVAPEVDGPVTAVVAVDGADAPTVAAARAAGADVVLELPERRGSYAARNAAVAALPDDVEAVVFTDADCIPQPGFLREHVAALAEADASGGAVSVTLPSPPTPASYVDRDRHLRQQHYVLDEGYAATANLALRREVLRELRFDERLRTGGDSEFGSRLRAAGYRLVYSAGAAVEHPARSTTQAVLTKVDRICGGMPALLPHWRTHPLPPLRVRRALVGRARAEGLSQGLLWELRVVGLDLRCQWRLRRGRRRALAGAGTA